MMPGPIQFIECPACRTLVLGETLSSGNTFGARFWSDGFSRAPMLPDYPRATRCRQCRKIFWLADGTLAGEEYFLSEEIRERLTRGELRYARHLTLPELKRFLAEASHTKERETELRLRLWWGMNHRIRRDPRKEVAASHQKLFAENLYILLHLLADDEESGLRLRCEVLRELGRFRDAERLAAKESESFDRGLMQILRKCAENDARVFEFTALDADVLCETHVAGIVFHDFASPAAQGELTPSSPILLRREPSNKFDSNAVEVITADGRKLGYIPREENRNIARTMDEGVPLQAVIVRVDPDASDWFRIKIAVFTGPEH